MQASAVRKAEARRLNHKARAWWLVMEMAAIIGRRDGIWLRFRGQSVE